MSMTRQQLVAAVDKASNVYVVTEISPGNPVRVSVDPADIKDIIQAEDWTLGNRLTVTTERYKEDDEEIYDLIIGGDEEDGDDEEDDSGSCEGGQCPTCDFPLNGMFICARCDAEIE